MKDLWYNLTKPSESKTINEIRGLISAIFIVVVFQTFLFKPFNIPSGSMYPTVMIGDFIVVSKYTYGFSKYSFPFAPNLFSGRIFGAAPERGDVIVFRGPHDPADDTKDYIKRCVGLPGDKIQMIKGILHINGAPVKLERIEDYPFLNEWGKTVMIPQYIETLPNGRKHRILKEKPFGQARLDNTDVYEVPPGHYFGMGDNRDNSGDSRILQMIGYIPEDHLLGQARVLFFSSSAKWYDFDKYISGMRPERIGQWVD